MQLSSSRSSMQRVEDGNDEIAMMKKIMLLLAIAILAACGNERSGVTDDVVVERQIELDATDADLERAVRLTLYRDNYGVPHVFADDNYGAYFGYGYAVATDRLFQMEMLKRTAQGRVAEVLGVDYLELDIKLRTQYDHALVRAQVDALSPRDREILEGYAAGFNARLDELEASENPGLPKPFYDYGVEPSRWSAFDVASIFVGSIAHRYADFNSERDNLAFLQAMEAEHGKEKAWDIFNGAKWLKDQTSPTTIAREGKTEINPLERPAYLDRLAPSAGVAHLVFDEQRRFSGLANNPINRERLRGQLALGGFGSHPEFTPASNYWAISQLSDAKGALLNGPQFDFGMPSYVYAIGLHGGDFDVVGSTLLAVPSLLFAHNNDLAWGSTAGISDLTDEFYLELNPENPEQYRYQGGWREFERREETVVVKGGDPVTVTARKAAQGMVQDWQPASGHAWVRARAWEGYALEDLMSWVWLATDRSLEAAEQRLAGKSTNINLYTMDKEGRLGYVHSGKYPNRAPGHDPRLPAVGDGSMDWQGLRPYADNPKVREPEQGYIVNWNNRPAADWISSDLWPYTWSRADRAHILIDEVQAALGGTVEQMTAINTRSTFEDVNHRYLLPLLEQAVASAEGVDERFSRALALLKRWDKSWVADETGHFGAANTLMEAWVRQLHRLTFLDDVGESQFHLFAATNYPNQTLGASLGTPVGVRIIVKMIDDMAEGEPSYDFFNGQSVSAVVLSSMTAALDELEASQSQNWEDWVLPAAPMTWAPVNFRGVPQASPENRFEVTTYLNRGTENNIFVATGEGIDARDVNPPGQGGHLNRDGSPAQHYDDQFELYKRFEYKTLPFTEEAVKAAAAMVMELQIEVGNEP